ncbi:MAG: tetratricopeptide repeat protein [Thermodesulfobacteriota bacterium]
MAKKIKYTQKELKGPDKFSSTVIAGFEYFSDHSKKIVLIVAAVIVVLIAGYILNNLRENKNVDATKMFNEAVLKYNAGNNEEALKGFQSLKANYPNNKISSIALYYTGIIDFKLGKYDGSINALNEFLDSGVDQDMLVQSAVLMQGLARFKQGKWQQAIEFLSKVQQEQGSPYEETAKIHMALAYEKLGQTEKAKAIYKNLYNVNTGINAGMTTNLRPSSRTDKN